MLFARPIKCVIVLLSLLIQGVLKMAPNIYVTGIYVESQTKNSNSNLVLDEFFLNYYYYQKSH
jgi:hypothetical protein